MKINVWVKSDGKTEVKVNDRKESEAKAKELGWKKKAKKPAKKDAK